MSARVPAIIALILLGLLACSVSAPESPGAALPTAASPLPATYTPVPSLTVAPYIPPTRTLTPFLEPTLTSTRPVLVMVVVEQANLRAGPGTNFEAVDWTSAGTTLIVYGRNLDGTWLLVSEDGSQWISASLVSFDDAVAVIALPIRQQEPLATAVTTSTATPTRQPYVRTLVSQVDLRTGPGTEYPTLVTLEVNVVAEPVGRNSSGDWLNVVTESGWFGWLRAAFVEILGTTAAELPIAPVPEPPDPEPQPAPGGGSGSGCCKICQVGQACGDTCISRSYTCHVGPGCSCNASSDLQPAVALVNLFVEVVFQNAKENECVSG